MNAARLFAAFAALIVFMPALVRADPSDPFDPSNQAPVLSIRTKKLLEVIALDVKISASQAKRGEVVRVTLTGAPAKGYHTYPINQITNQQDPSDSKIEYKGIDDIKPLWPVLESPPHLTQAIDGKIVFEHAEPFTWSQDLLVDPQAKPGKYDLTVMVRLQVCNKGGCYGPDFYRPLYIPLEILADAAVAPGKDFTDRLQGPPAPTIITPTAAEIAKVKEEAKRENAANPNIPDVGRPSAQNLGSFLWFACLSAFLMLLTPCVFPMIPITVNFFIKQSEKEHHNPLRMAMVYSGTIIILLTVIMLALGSIVIDLANNEWFNVALGIMLVVFALSLFGMYEIELPHFLARFTSAREGKGGMLGAMFMAMTFTITSFTCTGPFLGLMLGSVAGVQPPKINLILGAVVYSTTFAAPFFVLALFPSMLKKLPKSGSWLNSVKVTMGFLELGAALKFLSNADLTFFPGNPQIFNYDTVLAAWIALSISCSLYLLGLFRLPHDDTVETIGVMRMMISVGFLGLAIYLAPAMFGIKPAGLVGDNVVAFLPPRLGHENDNFGAGGDSSAKNPSGHKDWYKDYEDAWKDAVKNDKLIFIDFTAQQCVNCRLNEQGVFPRPEVKKELAQFVKVSLYTDSVPDPKLSAAEAFKQGQRNRGWQDSLTKDAALPIYLVFQPARDEPFENGEPKGKVLAKTEGAIFDVPAFVLVLKKAQESVVAQGKPHLKAEENRNIEVRAAAR